MSFLYGFFQIIIVTQTQLVKKIVLSKSKVKCIITEKYWKVSTLLFIISLQLVGIVVVSVCVIQFVETLGLSIIGTNF